MKAVKTNFKDRVAVKRHKELVHIIKENWPIFNKSRFAIGNALIELHDGGYWKSTHTSFADYCEETFGISDNYARRLMDAAKTQSELPEEWQSSIKNERQARALSDAPKSDRVEVLKVASQNGHITEKSIRDAMAKVEEMGGVQNVPMGTDRVSVKSGSESGSKPQNSTRKKEPTLVDDVNTPIPLDAMPYAIRQKEVGAVLSQISKLRSDIKKARDGKDYLWVKHGQDAYEYLSRAYSYISDASPDCVCLTCQGTYSMQKDGCNACGNTGMISQYRFDHFLPREMREIRILSNADYVKTHEITKIRPDPKNVR
jgi:hypothetical protein